MPKQNFIRGHVNIIKENNLVDISKFYSTFHGETVSTLKSPENCKARNRATSFYRGRQLGIKKSVFSLSWLAGVVYLTLFRARKSLQIFGIWGLAGWIYSVSGQVKHLQEWESYLSFNLLMWHPREELLHLGPKNLFQQPLEFP